MVCRYFCGRNSKFIAAMYIPKINRHDQPDEVWRFIEANSFGLLISQVEGRPWATHIPILTAARPDGTMYLHGHLAKANPQWRHWQTPDEILAVFSGPHTYISSSWYDHPNVPTWNYTAVHVYGKIRLIEGEELYASIKSLVDKYEAKSERPVSMENLPPDMIRREMRGVVGFEIDITEVQAKEKLSQNRNDHNHTLIVNELEKRNELFDADIADQMKKKRNNLPATDKG